ncbi:MAG: molybdopterin converting factor subunit 1 [Gammaproteobacteria bacterium]|jgi:molybdopterin synthase sulfur carrier subunit|nr:molybdopterin converting factor subunit 1 [Gammaproteobacteria bacterium]
MIQLRYFASLRESLGIGDEQIELPGAVHDLPGLTCWLQARDDNWASALADSRLHVAINQEIAKPDATVSDGDEVAWFPPVTGG